MNSAKATEDDFVSMVSAQQLLIKKICRLYAFTDDVRQDLFQEIVLQLWKAFPSFRQESLVTTWLYRVALNTAITYRRREQKHRTSDVSLPDQQILDNGEEKEQVRMLYQTIGKLNKIDKALVFLHLEGYNYREISGLSGLTETNVATKLSRIRKHLAKEMEKIYSK